ncbi:MAG: glycosyl hydrolase, partial [Anaerovorax sp.]
AVKVGKAVKVKRIAASIMIVVMAMVLMPQAPVYGGESVPEGSYWVETGQTYDKFVNNVHGYSLNIDKGMKVDMSMSGVCAVLENSVKRIEIYKQPLINGTTRASYLNYSNKFLTADKDIKKEYESTQKINGKTVSILQYSREKLARVKNDKNFYVNLEIQQGNTMYSIFVKSASPLWEVGGYDYLAANFTVFTPTHSAYNRQTQPISLSHRGWNDETASLYTQYFSDDSPLSWGIFEPAAPEYFSDLEKIEQSIAYEFPFILNYTSFDNPLAHPNLKARLDNAYANGKIMELTLQTPAQTWGNGNMVYDILNGEYDSFLKDYAKTVSEFDHPVLFRLANEMNGDWCPYSGYHTGKDTLVFKEFYRYVYSFFEDAKADNVIWVWNPNGVSFPNFEWNNALMYYPGDAYVDIVGLTAYNTGTYYKDEKWTDFAKLYDNLYNDYAHQYKQPLIISEFASSSVGGDKNRWITDMFEHIQNYDRIKLAIWWDGCDWDTNGNVARPYFIDETPQILETFKKYLNIKPLNWDAYA